MTGRRFTWFWPNGKARSQIDKVMVTRDWLNLWPNSIQCIFDRNISDHCPFVIKNHCVD